jgi:hypothetical protein
MVLALTGVSLLTLVVVGVLFYTFLGGYVIDRQKEQLLEQAAQVSEQVQALSGSVPNAMSMTGMLTILLRSNLRLLPTGAGIVIFRGTEVVAKVGVLPVRGQNLSQLREEGRRVGGSEPGSDLVRSTCWSRLLLSGHIRRHELWLWSPLPGPTPSRPAKV